MSGHIPDFLLHTEQIESAEIILPEEQGTETPEQEPAEQSLVPDGTYHILIPEDVADYFAGYLDVNNAFHDYAAYGYREYLGGTYTDTYMLLYNLTLEADGSVSPGEYPFVKIVQYEGNSTVQYGTASGPVIPDLSYGSYSGLAELRGGGEHYVTLALFFAVCTALCFNVLRGFFDFAK